MRAESACSRYRAELSARLDGDVDASMTHELEEHLLGCEGCRSFEAGRHSLRRTLRLAPVEVVPDVTARVMAAIGTESTRRRRELRFKLASVAAVAAALVVLASSLPILESEPRIANASEVTRQAFSAARALDSYQATFEIIERTWHPDVPVRRFEAKVWYEAPERLRLRVRDHTDLPEGAWPTNDVDLIAGPRGSWIREPYSCPPQALPGCAIEAGVEQRSVVGRHPFDGTSTAPTEIVLPLATLATSDAFTVAGPESIAGREAVHIVLTYRQAYPLIKALQVGGSWAPLFPLDRVDLWLERGSSFPLRFEVSRPGSNAPVLEVNAVGFDRSHSLPEELFVVPEAGNVRQAGFRPGPVNLPAAATPAVLAGLKPYRSGIADRSRVVTYADGMSYLKVTAQRATPGSVLPAEIVELRPDSFGLYRPAQPNLPRRVEISGRDLSVRLESNLRRVELLRVAASLPLDGLRPARVRAGGAEMIPLSEKRLDALPLVRRPARLPPGYGPFSAQMIRTKSGTEVTIVFFAAEAAWEGSEIRVFHSSRISMLPPSSESLTAVDVNGSPGRWSSERGELEWIDDDGIYRSIAAPSFDLASVMAIAEGLR